jgi:hypothetical protein
MKVKSLRYSIVLAAIFLTAIGIACIDLLPSEVIIYAFGHHSQPHQQKRGHRKLDFRNH